MLHICSQLLSGHVVNNTTIYV